MYICQCLFSIRVTNNEQIARSIYPKSDPSILILTVLLIKHREGLGIKKDGSSPIKGNAMVFQVPLGFDGIPLKLILERAGHCRIISRNRR